MASPTWYQAIPKGEWAASPSSVLSSSGVMETSGGKQMEAWGGAILVTGGLYIGSTQTTGTFLIPWGGGHTDYSGNEIYAFGPLENNSPAWNKLRNPTSPAPQDINTDGSGNPVSRHTYNTAVYINDGTNNIMLMMGVIFRYIDSGGGTEMHAFNFNQTGPNTNQPWSTFANLTSGNCDVAAYYPAAGRVFYHKNSANHAGYFNVAAGTFSDDTFKSPLGYGGGGMSAMDNTRGIWCLWDNSNGLSFFDAVNGLTGDYYRPRTRGDIPARADGTGTATIGTLGWDSLRDRFVFWFDGAGKKIYELIPPAANPYQNGDPWTWKLITPGSGSTPTSPWANGTYGRFQCVNNNTDIRGYILMNKATDSLYFYNSSIETPGVRPTLRKFPPLG